jgi:HPt (histidine-containing phosphotransfer) domain-containing protein
MITNLSYLEGMTEGDSGLITEMIGIFSTQVTEFSTLMHNYLEQKNWQELSKLVHKAKSSVAIMGMTELTEKLRKFEKLTMEEKEVHTYPDYVNSFTTASRDAVTELNNYLTTL